MSIFVPIMATIKLKQGKQESSLRKHPWIFSGAIHSADGDIEEGDIVDVVASDGTFLGRGHSAIGSIAVRILEFEDRAIDGVWWYERFAQALKVRRAVGLPCQQTNCYRLIHGEGDMLPGLIVDIYDSVAVMQAHSVGMFLERKTVCENLQKLFAENGLELSAVYDKSSATLPPKSGIETRDEYLYKSDSYSPVAQKDSGVPALENGHCLLANWELGQKTGFFLDQRDNRLLVGQYSPGRRVLNTFCYTGGFSVYALAAGAVSVDSVDSSERAIRLATANIEANNPTAPHREIAQDALDFIRDMPAEAYDLVILDPPAFAKHHKVLNNALQGYKRLNARAIEKIAPGGILFTFSCSQAVSREQFRMAVFSAAAIAKRRVRILHQLTQGADHPVNIYHPEGEYLKGLVVYVE